MTFQKPPPYTRPKQFGDLFNQEATGSVTILGSAPPSVQALTYVLERAPESAGSDSMSFASGRQYGPISVGTAGDFRIEGGGVLDIHGYVVFDGEGTFLCSADGENPLLADGRAVPLDWTRVGVPCTLGIGRARATLRTTVTATPSAVSLPDYSSPQLETEPATDPRAPTSKDPVDAGFDNAPTPYDGVAPPMSAPPAPRASGAFRPRAPSHGDDESTVVAPDRAGVTGPQKRLGDDDSTKRANEVVRTVTGALALAPPKPPPPPPPISAPPKGGYAPPMQGGGRTPHVYPPPPPLATVPVMRPQPRTIATRVPRGAQPTSQLHRIVDILAADLAPGSPRRIPILAAGAVLVAACLATIGTLAWQNLQSSRLSTSSSGRTQSTALPPNPVVSTPPLGVIVTPAPARPPVDLVPASSAVPPRAKPAAPLPPTVERTAVDALSERDLAAALAAYRQLAREQPDNPAFARAVHTLESRGSAPR